MPNIPHLAASFTKRAIYPFLLSLILGAATVLAFAPWQYFVIAILTPALLEALLIKLKPKGAALCCFAYGIGLFGCGISWVFVSIHDYSEAPLWAGLVITGGFVVVLSALLSLVGYTYRKLLPDPRIGQRFLGFASLWVLLEAFRSGLLTGFPWLYLGYTLIDTPFVGFAPILGIYGLSFMCVFYGMALLQLSSPRRVVQGFAAAIVLLMPLAGFMLQKVQWTSPMKQSYQLGLAQGNIPQEMKWNPQAAKQNFSQYYQLSQSLIGSDIMIWPEAALPYPLPTGQMYVDVLSDFAHAFKTTFLVGVIHDLNPDVYTNSVIVVGDGQGQYDKYHLVPFGEYIPYYRLLGKTFDWLKLPKSFTVPGKEVQAPLQVKGWKVGTLICYEVVYPELARLRARDANVLLTVSNDTWFGHSLGPDQHFQMARMRAAETGLPMIRVTNNGITGFINPNGTVNHIAPRDASSVLRSTVEGYRGQTPITRIGHHTVVWAVLLIWILVWIFSNALLKSPLRAKRVDPL